MSLQNNLVFEEIETLELNGNGRDFYYRFWCRYRRCSWDGWHCINLREDISWN